MALCCQIGFEGRKLVPPGQKKHALVASAKIIRVSEDGAVSREQTLAREETIELYVNGKYIAGLVCTPEKTRELLTGFLFSEGIIKTPGEIKHLASPDGIRYAATIETSEGYKPGIEKSIIASGCGHSIVLDGELPLEVCHKEIDHRRVYKKQEILEIGKKLAQSGSIHKDTRGTHGAAIFDRSSLVISAEDISRHNAVDKVIGHCRMKNIRLKDKVLATTGRISSEIIRKLVRNRMSIIVSRTVPTAAAIEFADHFMITSIGAVTSHSFSIYSHPFRIDTE